MNIAELFIRMTVDPTGVKKGSKEAESAITSSVRGMTRALASLGVAFGAGAFLRSMIKNSIEAQDAMAQLAARIKSTGGAAGRSLQQLDDLATALQKTTTFSDEAVKGAEALLLTFKKIKGAEFDRATRATLDLATALGTDLKSAALQLGKALEDPIRGLTALRRSGVSFTKEQEALIKRLVETGQVAAAQNLILAEMETQFGGAAEAARDTLGGALQALGNAWGETLEVTRESSAGIIGAINGIIELLPKIRDFADRVVRFWQRLGIESAVLVERLKLLALSFQQEGNLLGAVEGADAIEKQTKAIERMRIAADGMLHDLATDGPAANTQVRELIQNFEEAAAAVRDLSAEVRGIPVVSEREGITAARAGFEAAGEAGAARRAFLNAIANTVEGLPTRATAGTGATSETVSTFRKAVDSFKDGVGEWVKSTFSGANVGLSLAQAGISTGLSLLGKGLGAIFSRFDSAAQRLAAAMDQNTRALKVSSDVLRERLAGFESLADQIGDAIQNTIDRIGLGEGVVPFPGTGQFTPATFLEELQKLGLTFADAQLIADKLGISLDSVTTGVLQQFADQIGNATDAVTAMTETLRNVPEIWNAALGRFRAGAIPTTGTVAGTGGIGGLPIPGQRPTTYTFTGPINVNGVQNIRDFMRQLSEQVTRDTARGGVPVLTDATLRPAF